MVSCGCQVNLKLAPYALLLCTTCLSAINIMQRLQPLSASCLHS
uniref:Uncharacterized protein n=1 Tax=Arundo donax TaxID=35708 RepID=A0A0A9BDS8_ARUDO